MHFNTYITLLPLLSTLASGLPLEVAQKPRNLAPRAKSYDIVNVDGGSSTPNPPRPTTVVEKKTTTETETVKITPPSTPDPMPAPTTTKRSINSSSTKTPATTPTPTSSCESSSKAAAETPKPSVIFITVTEPSDPTSYYDDGMWHTSYAIKTFAAAVAVTPSAESSMTTSVIPSAAPTKAR